MIGVNACTFCKHTKRKCNKTRPSCSNCSRLGKACVYSEDVFQDHFDLRNETPLLELDDLKILGLNPVGISAEINLSSHEIIQQSTVDFVMRILGSPNKITNLSTVFFTGTHQRISEASKHRFQQHLQSLAVAPHANFAALCLCVLLVEQKPASKPESMQSALYFTVKNLVSLLETKNELTIELVHCRLLTTFYEVGHGLHTAAYVSIAVCARSARTLGLHKKRWRDSDTHLEKLVLEEEKRTWWGVIILERFINLCNGDAMLISNDPVTSDPLPVDDLLWSELSTLKDLETLLNHPPLLDTPFDTTVGQMARECQVSHLVGQVIQHVFDPTSDAEHNAETACQLERTLKAYLPLLSNEELKIGKYCGAYGMCNSALFTLYNYMLSRDMEGQLDQNQVLQLIEETSIGALSFAKASYLDRDENHPPEVLLPYLPYSLCQAVIAQRHLWRQTGTRLYKERMDIFETILSEFTKRWMMAGQFLQILESLDSSCPSFEHYPRDFVVIPRHYDI